jgi:hypothetical protein
MRINPPDGAYFSNQIDKDSIAQDRIRVKINIRWIQYWRNRMKLLKKTSQLKHDET